MFPLNGQNIATVPFLCVYYAKLNISTLLCGSSNILDTGIYKLGRIGKSSSADLPEEKTMNQ